MTERNEKADKSTGESRHEPAGARVPRERRRQANTAVNDQKASKGDAFSRGDNVSGESNDPSLVHGPTRVRKVPPGDADA
ncbi:hypothetical protein QFW77_08825 [Luteimonas sp. RD2P54]|uniref:Uncharacterized protein n=1 Tax=Luteimonas endophytica TaxID=3042023 RepID=A0ABT6J8D8_9GAMM|nr:hypothetical protein [Luteimonas endophytica]MDH5823091.1 hypothetical protein [Luteimonas endophytica]